METDVQEPVLKVGGDTYWMTENCLTRMIELDVVEFCSTCTKNGDYERIYHLTSSFIRGLGHSPVNYSPEFKDDFGKWFDTLPEELRPEPTIA